MAEKKKAAAKASAKKTTKPAKSSAKVAKVTEKTEKAEKKVYVKASEKAANNAPKAKEVKKPVIIQEKKKIIETFAVHAKDTGSAQVQIAILTSRIDSLQSHLKDHSKDNHSRKGLLAMVGKRRKHLDYLKNRKPDEYEKVIKDLGLRR